MGVTKIRGDVGSMKLSRVLRATILLCAGFAGVHPSLFAAANSSQQGSWTLDNVLKQLDTQATEFRSLTADLDRTKVTVVVNDKSTESGKIMVRRDDKMRIELMQPIRGRSCATATIFTFTIPKFTASRNTTWETRSPWWTNSCCWALGRRDRS